MTAWRTSDFDYDLPAARIAQTPLEPRDAARLLQVAPSGALSDHSFRELPALLRPGDLLVANDTRVRRARLRGRTGSGGVVELLVIERHEDGAYLCLARPARAMRPGVRVRIDADLEATAIAVAADHAGARLVRFDADDPEAAIERAGSAPLPPYIHERFDVPDRYQTVYARGAAASAAAPTAGLHFTESSLRDLRHHRVGWATVQLNVGLATFAPMRTERVDAHRMHAESFCLPPQTATAITATRRRGGRVVAVGTTVTRVLETCATAGGTVEPRAGRTDLFIRHGHRFRVVDGLVTNFHQPRSTLLVLLAALLGIDAWRAAYAHALAAGYRFLSLGDCMLAWRREA